MNEYAVTVEDAMSRLDVLPDYDPGTGPQPCVHTFAQSAVGMLGAHWPLDDVRAYFAQHGVEEAGEQAQAMRHGLVVTGGGRTIFFATKGTEAGPDA